jgi:hypothetical protein
MLGAAFLGQKAKKNWRPLARVSFSFFIMMGRRNGEFPFDAVKKCDVIILIVSLLIVQLLLFPVLMHPLMMAASVDL